MALETEDRHGQSVLELPQSLSKRCSSRDLVDDGRPLADARGDAGEVRPPTPQTRGPSGLPLESPAPACADEHVEHAWDAGIADEAFFRVSFGDNLCQT